MAMEGLYHMKKKLYLYMSVSETIDIVCIHVFREKPLVALAG